jgi:predicted Zn-dependent protease
VKKYIAAFVILCSIFLGINRVDAYDCNKVNFKEVFFEDYFENSLWQKTNSIRQIRWSMSSNYVYGQKVSKSFSETEKEWVRLAFNSIDNALESFAFIENNTNPDIVIGYTNLKNYAGYWTAEQSGLYRERGYIQLNPNIGWWFDYKEKFIHTVQHELGNVLGVGDIKPSNNIISVFEDPSQKPYGLIPMSDFDIKLLKQLYGEDLCVSRRTDYPQTYLIATP